MQFLFDQLILYFAHGQNDNFRVAHKFRFLIIVFYKHFYIYLESRDVQVVSMKLPVINYHFPRQHFIFLVNISLKKKFGNTYFLHSNQFLKVLELSNN